ncbi:hypothetical protein C8D88_102844 [Lentzea atacamensis]|uniref:Uncharacterized protein n=1 Tax=Lentzea atacamensis TaxID=531938 RepID=A0A316I947_9PSEU|nr:hypothetical protein [Lentzea atacamensis]PWK89569.1 hypothetical protein C8D88_102844 [Lentzea atacamensis]
MLTGGAVLVFAIIAGVFLLDDWTAFLSWGSLSLVLTIVVFVSQWHYIRRGPSPGCPRACVMAPPSSDSSDDG